MKRFPVDARRVPCRVDPEPFFSRNRDTQDAAARLCETCPLQADCLAIGIENGEQWGIWGGRVFTAESTGRKPMGPPVSTYCRAKLHRLDAANTYLHRSGRRECRQCRRDRERERSARKREQQLAAAS
ncbi:WhiB family transcriptional regulator [Gordonia sp. (in: high G+C Gram-positive bacteria)]|uniref:WhiB family transcriptional regulator n=1 Tax=Gordonia sp. (in: high G+C Gram-positive bacteria) TaxID=84139 RepID=UPI003F9995FD